MQILYSGCRIYARTYCRTKETLERAEKYLNTIVLGYPQQSVIYYGLRGVGKTVLLNAIECKTDDMPILMGHIEIAEKRNFT